MQTASDKLNAMIKNDEITQEQLDLMQDYNIMTAAQCRKISKHELSIAEDENEENMAIITLYNLIDDNRKPTDFIVADGYGQVSPLDEDTLDDILES